MRCTTDSISIELPNGDVIMLPVGPQAWWEQHGGSGYADPCQLAPDPKQPRKDMNPKRLAELKESVRSRGVRDGIVVTPRSRAPWASVLPEHEHLPLIIVSGHRRTRSAVEVELRAVPIEVRIYPNEKEHRSDVSLLNKGQDPLTELEEGYEILSLKQAGWTLEQLSDQYGWNSLTIRYRLNLTQLDPTIQAAMNSELPEKERIALTTAQHLGGVMSVSPEKLQEIAGNMDAVLKPRDLLTEDSRRFALQRVLYDVIKKRNLNTQRATALIKDMVLKYRKGGRGDRMRSEYHQPRRRLNVLETLCDGVGGSVVVDWQPQEFERILANASREDIDELVRRFEAASETLRGVTNRIRTVALKKQPTRPEVQAILNARRTKQTAA
ncbi:MAG: ParB N-terminal domain-containing protein [Candidatus Pacebacteria bacterium]|nr:ParB N-terminal domain-containing protein [Candidatus Paceibacterota bacterium]